MDKETLEKIKALLYKWYRVNDKNSSEGCYCNGRWLSVADVLNVIEETMVE